MTLIECLARAAIVTLRDRETRRLARKVTVKTSLVPY